MHINVKFSYCNNPKKLQFIYCMFEGCNSFRQHDTVREIILYINNTFSKGMTIANS